MTIPTEMNSNNHGKNNNDRQTSQSVTLALTDQTTIQQLATSGYMARSARRAGQLRRQYAAEKAAGKAKQAEAAAAAEKEKANATKNNEDQNEQPSDGGDDNENAEQGWLPCG